MIGTVSSMNNHAKDGGPGRSELHVDFTIILCGTHFIICQCMKLIFTSSKKFRKGKTIDHCF